MNKPSRGSRALSVVIPAYNSAPWLPSTLEALFAALALTSWRAEIVVVDDGSTDDTAETLAAIATAAPYPLRVIRQRNEGRLVARLNGVRAAAYDDLLLLDSRVVVHEGSFAHLEAHTGDARLPVNGHVVTDPTAALVGQFWAVPTHVFWAAYLADPRPMDITPENFDRVPKGTGFLYVDKGLFERASVAASPDSDTRLASDDTALLRFIVHETALRLDPGFSATYRPRETVRGFLAHAFDRGTMFVDSYAGTSAWRNIVIVLLALAPLLAVAALVTLLAFSQWIAAAALIVLSLAAVAAPALLAAARRCPPRAVLAYLVWVVPFGFVFCAGLARGVLVHRRSFSGRRA